MSEKTKKRLQKLEMKSAPGLFGGVAVVCPDHVEANGTRYADFEAVPDGHYLVISGPTPDAETWSAQAVAHFEEITHV